MRGLNKVMLIGTLGRDPEVHYRASGITITTISIATSEKWKDKETGEDKEKTEWHNIVFFRRLAEVAGEYLKKGSKIYVEGKMRTEKWQDKEGNNRYTTKVYADSMQMLGDPKNKQAKAQEKVNHENTDTGIDLSDDIPF